MIYVNLEEEFKVSSVTDLSGNLGSVVKVDVINTRSGRTTALCAYRRHKLIQSVKPGDVISLSAAVASSDSHCLLLDENFVTRVPVERRTVYGSVTMIHNETATVDSGVGLFEIECIQKLRVGMTGFFNLTRGASSLIS